MSEAPLVTVILPVYNGASFIGEALESIRAQTLASWQALVIDDGSTDGLVAAVEPFSRNDARVRLLSQPHLGLPAARNHGIRAAAGKYLQFLDADDKIEPAKLEKQAFFIEKNPQFDIIYGDVAYFGEDRKPGLPAVRRAGASGTLGALIRENIAPVNCFLLKKELARRINLFDETFESHEDWDFWIRCARSGAAFRYEPLPDTKALVRLHGGSMIRDKHCMIKTRLCVRHRHHPALDRELVPVSKRLIRRDEGRLAYVELGAGKVTPGRVIKIIKALVTRKDRDD